MDFWLLVEIMFIDGNYMVLVEVVRVGVERKR